MNVAFKIVLTEPYGAPGLALATAIGAWVNVGLLFFLAWRRGWTAPNATLGKALAVSLVASLALAGAVLALREPAAALAARLPALEAEAHLALLALAGGLVYGVLVLAGLKARPRCASRGADHGVSCRSASASSSFRSGSTRRAACSPSSIASVARWNSKRPIAPSLGEIIRSGGSPASREREDPVLGDV